METRLSGTRSALLTAKLSTSTGSASAVTFLVDSGASLSFVARSDVQAMLSPAELAAGEQPSALVDAQGRPLEGLPVDFEVVVGGLPTVLVPIWVSRGVARNMLGLTFFEHLNVTFLNWSNPEKDGRPGFWLEPKG